MTKYNPYTARKVLKRLITDHISPHMGKLMLSGFFMVIVAITAASIVKIVQPAVDKVFIENDKSLLYSLPLITLFLSITKGFAEYYQNYLIKSVGQRILSDLQIKLYDHLLKADIDFINSQSSARLISRFTNDISLMRSSVSNLFVGVAKHLLTIIFLIVIMFQLDPILSCIIFFVFPVAIYPIQINGRRIRKLAHSAQEQLGNYTSKLDETFDSIKIVKSYQAEDFESKRAKNFIEEIYEIYRSTAKYDARTSPIMECLSGVAVSIIILYGGFMTASGQITPGTLMAFIGAFVSAYRPYKSMISFNVNLQEGIAASTRLFKVLDTKPVIEDDKDGVELNISNSEIKFENVLLKYGEKVALDHLSLQIPHNSRVAIVGFSGSGKTSIANALLRFYKINEGKISAGGSDIEKIKLSSLRHQIAVVTQETMLFEATVAENIAYSFNDATRAGVVEAAKAASAHDFITKLPKGYDTKLGSGGKNLSGGQRQRIAIARAFLKDAPIIILDEATSSLDPSTEQEIKSSLNKLSKGRTTIIITHRIHTIEEVDKIYVIDEGKVVETGTHKELIEHNGIYAKLHKEQKDTNYTIFPS